MSLVSYMPLDNSHVDARSDVYLGVHADTLPAGLSVVALEYVASCHLLRYAVEQLQARRATAQTLL